MVFKSSAKSATPDPESAALKREQATWARLLGPGEHVTSVHRLGRTTALFTNRRLVFVEEGVTGRSVEYLSVPYRAVTSFAVEASGQFSTDADLRIWVSGRTAPIERAFGQGADVYEVQGLLAQHVAGVS